VEQGELIAAFRQRARFEAERYGTDQWVFVRELLQNARDAGARQVWFGVEMSEGRERISCRDDGSGMSFDHARRYLFTLYASSKRDQAKVAGRFGIGFWSVLRYAPELIAIRSRSEDGEGWEVTLDGALERATHSQCVMLPGTEIVLERPAAGGDLEAAIAEAATADARYLRCRDDAALPLEVTVNGHAVTAEFGAEHGLPASRPARRCGAGRRTNGGAVCARPSGAQCRLPGRAPVGRRRSTAADRGAARRACAQGGARQRSAAGADGSRRSPRGPRGAADGRAR
jgi:hypothetical protein